MGVYNNPEEWSAYCERLRVIGMPKTNRDALRIIEPSIAQGLDDTEKALGIADIDGFPDDFDPESLAETRVPLARAATALRKAGSAKQAKTKRKYLNIALWWLANTHPWMGSKSAQLIAAERVRTESMLRKLRD